MKERSVKSGLTIGAGILLSGMAMAQSVPEQFVVSGKAAVTIKDHTTINLATAQKIAETCESLVAARGEKRSVERDRDGNPMYPIQINGEAPQHTIIVLDNDGNHVYFDRMDGQGYTNVVTAEMKARTALLTRAPSKATMNRVARDPNQEAYEVQLGLYPVAGGLPIIVGNQTIGFVGAGGYRPNPPVWSDEICVHRAMIEVLGPTVPPLLEDIPESSEHASAGGERLPVPTWGSTKAPQTNLQPEWVVSGAAAAHVLEGNQISLAAAKKLASGCRQFAASNGTTMSLYVLDNAGEMVHMERMDGELPADARTALLKAQTALRLREPTSMRGAPMKNAGYVPPRNVAPNMFNFYLGIGGIPVVVDGQMIGSVGVSAADSTLDEKCAIAGLTAAFGAHALLPQYSTQGRNGK
jgi:glc operon protein GlcG